MDELNVVPLSTEPLVFDATESNKFQLQMPQPFPSRSTLIKKHNALTIGSRMTPLTSLQYVENLLGHFVRIPGGLLPVNLPEFFAGETVLTQESVVKILELGYSDKFLNLGSRGKIPFQNPALNKKRKYCPGESKDHPGEPEYIAFVDKHGNIDSMCRGHPAEGMNWDFIKRILIPTINKIIKDTGFSVELLDDNQIDLAHRGLVIFNGVEIVRQTTYLTGNNFNQDDESDLNELGRYYYFFQNSKGPSGERQTHPVKSKEPNNLGIYYASVLELSGSRFDEGDTSENPLRSARGCNLWGNARRCFLAERHWVDPSFADLHRGVRLRLVRTSLSALLPSNTL